MRELFAEARAHHRAAEQLADDVGDGTAPAEASERPAPGVLVVDDHDDSREMMALVLREAGVVVHTACNGLEALIVAHEVRPALIFMDLHMPVLDGFEATRLIRAIDALRHAPIVAYTSQPSVDSTVARTLFTAILEKPALPRVLLATVQRFAKA